MTDRNHTETADVAIIGGGAAGLACAVACAQERRRAGLPALRIVVLEAQRRAGASIMRSGNGRCNFSNARLDVGRYRGADLVRRSLAALPATGPDVLPWFAGLGLEWREAPGSDGMLYPFSNRAESVLDVLLNAAREAGVEVRTGVRVAGVAPQGAGFALSLEVTRFEAVGPRGRLRAAGSEPAALRAAQVVLAAGGAFDDALLSGLGRGFEVVSPRAVLGPLEAKGPAGESCAPLDGIRAQVRLAVPARGFAEEGEVLFRPYGVSGIVVFNASRAAHPGDTLVLDLVPDRKESELTASLERRTRLLAGRPAAEFLDGFVLRPLGLAVLERAGVSPDLPVGKGIAGRVAAALKGFTLVVGAVADPRASQVQRGGIAVEAVDPATCAVRGVPGAYAVGEALDVDGPCGGYNLHWAWASGLLAGRAAAHGTERTRHA